MKTSRFDSRGMSLIEVSIALGIASVMSMAMVTLLQSQARETQALSDKLAALDFQRTVEGAISIADACKNNVVGNFAPGQPQTFDPASITTTDKNNPKVLANLQKVYGGLDGHTVLADSTSSDRTVSPLSNNLKLKAGSGMQLAAYKDATSGQIVYQLQLVFDNTTLVRPIHNLVMTINATTGPDPANPSNLLITGCTGALAAATGAGGDWCGAFQGGPPGPYIWYGTASGDASTPHVKSVISTCHGKTPGSPGPDSLWYDIPGDSLCPSGYTLKVVGVGSVSYSNGEYAPEGGGILPSMSSTVLYTCMAQ